MTATGEEAVKLSQLKQALAGAGGNNAGNQRLSALLQRDVQNPFSDFCTVMLGSDAMTTQRGIITGYTRADGQNTVVGIDKVILWAESGSIDYETFVPIEFRWTGNAPASDSGYISLMMNTKNAGIAPSKVGSVVVGNNPLYANSGNFISSSGSDPHYTLNLTTGDSMNGHGVVDSTIFAELYFEN